MSIRYLKIALLLCVSLQALIYAVQNIVNLEQAIGSFAYVMGGQDHVAYPNSIIPNLTHPGFLWAALLIVLTGEFSAGVLTGRGALDLWNKRSAPAAEFEQAKTTGILGCGIAVVTWFGLFLVLGSALFQMWQTQIGDGSFRGAFYMLMSSGLVMIFVNTPER